MSNARPGFNTGAFFYLFVVVVCVHFMGTWSPTRQRNTDIDTDNDNKPIPCGAVAAAAATRTPLALPPLPSTLVNARSAE